ncbi:Flagellar motor protein [Roseovarius mucosus DSM 17069]|uniref:Flagellar motor protein n=1 Tax=Roseovarius mucosus DSM 17069 TaxID=1288298 RepID=A0A0A0HMJ9_9RHOB|nr:peptidoglycan -binding protein [Roseovarius mucosus]KGM88201.1 Flagellar motor protein [Roseovarius mucosus DSM 17069]
MALSRRSGARFQASIWPGFVDAMTGLLLVLMFVLTIFMMVQFVLREEISGQATKLDALSAEVAALSLALGLEQDRSEGLEDRVGTLTATLDDARTREAAQAEALRIAQGRIASFEEQVAGLLAEREAAQGRISDLEAARAELLSDQEQLQLALAGLRDEVDAQAEAARLAAARREALEALAADLRQRNADAAEAQAALEQQLSAEEQARLTEAAAAEALRARLAEADTELTAMTLALEEQRKRAEETLTLLAAAETARSDLNSQLAQALLDAEQEAATQEADIERLQGELAEVRDTAAQTAQEAQAVRDQLVAALAAQRAAEAAAETQMTEAEQRAALLAEARARLATEAAQATEAQKQQALLNQQVAALRQQLSGLQALLDESKAREAETEVQLQSLGNELNTALARVAAEERRRRIAEEERARLLEAEKENLEKYRSEFFGRLRDVLGQQEGVQIVGDRFVFSSEVLFAPGEAELSPAGRGEIAKVAGILRNVIGDIPEGINWVLQVDGHTDNVPIIEGARFADNWALSQARALSVVRYLTEVLGFPAERLSANGYGEFQPVNPADTPEARAQNRRIELKLTTR